MKGGIFHFPANAVYRCFSCWREAKWRVAKADLGGGEVAEFACHFHVERCLSTFNGGKVTRAYES